MRKLEPSFHRRIWGATDLAPWFPKGSPNEAPIAPVQAISEPIGEVWFETPEVPLLVKFLFTRENLSVQVHPDDDYARVHHGSPGKTEMWHVLAAEPGAKIAAGFREPITKERAREAALTGEIEHLLGWHSAAPGDTFYIPAGTVHAIGAGLTICEIQQRSDITYRFYDYGRGRELHLESALAVAELRPHQAKCDLPVHSQHFITEAFHASGGIRLPATESPALLIAHSGTAKLSGQEMSAGEVWLVGSQVTDITGDCRFLRVRPPVGQV